VKRNLTWSKDCNYCPDNYHIYWDSITKRYYDDPGFTIPHRKHSINNIDNDEIKQIKKIMISLLKKVQHIEEKLEEIKNK